MMNLIFMFLIALPIFAETKPYKILIISSPEAMTRAEEYKNYLRKQPPFSKMNSDLEIVIATMDEDKMKCGNTDPNAVRVIYCDGLALHKKQAEYDAHIAVAFTTKGSGGAGGAIPVASTDYKIQTMMHEMLHAYGFADEYSYKVIKQSEFDTYCKNIRDNINMAYFKDEPPYADDKAAREKHQSQIPWFGKIPDSQLITHQTDLGSTSKQSVGKQVVGLYRGGACDSSFIPGWRPYENSIMRDYWDDTVYPLYEEVVVKQIETKLGRKLNLVDQASNCLQLDASLGQISSLKEDTDGILQHIDENESRFERGM